MSLDTPQVETADKFYTTDTTELNTPPAEPVTTADIQDPPQEEEVLDKPEEVEAKADTEAEEPESKDDEEELYLDLFGEEVTLKDVQKWQKGHMMQSDYTKKTTALAEERKTFDAERTTERENLLKSQTEVTEMRDMLSVLVAEDEAIDWVELKEDDPERYIELTEKADSRKAALEKVKAERSTPTDDPAVVAAEQGKLFSANPDWLDKDGNRTESFNKDIGLMNDYAVNAGFSVEEFNAMTKAHYLTTILKAAKFDQLQDKGREIKAKREKVPVVTKPKATNATSESKPAHEVFYGT
jgi:hypothetical protein